MRKKWVRNCSEFWLRVDQIWRYLTKNIFTLFSLSLSLPVVDFTCSIYCHTHLTILHTCNTVNTVHIVRGSWLLFLLFPNTKLPKLVFRNLSMFLLFLTSNSLSLLEIHVCNSSFFNVLICLTFVSKITRKKSTVRNFLRRLFYPINVLNDNFLKCWMKISLLSTVFSGSLFFHCILENYSYEKFSDVSSPLFSCI